MELKSVPELWLVRRLLRARLQRLLKLPGKRMYSGPVPLTAVIGARVS